MIHQGVSLSEYTTLKVGGNAEYFADVSTFDELREALGYAMSHRMPVTFLGGGSNVLVFDSGVSGMVIRVGLRGITETVKGNDVLVTAGAGEPLDGLIAYCVEHGYWGLENLSHIPGTVGATPIQNVGAYGVEVSDCIVSVETIHVPTQTPRTFAHDECLFGYRDSWFKSEEGKEYCVTSVTYRLSKQPTPRVSYKDLATRNLSAVTDPKIVRNAIIEIRSAKFPDWHTVGTAGSFFKNPVIAETRYRELAQQYEGMPAFPAGQGFVKIPLGWILDHVCHVRGYREGNVGTFEGQALVLVHYGHGSAAEINAFATMICNRVHDATGIEVEWEVRALS